MRINLSQVKKGLFVAFYDGASTRARAWHLAGKQGISTGRVRSGTVEVQIVAPGHPCDGKIAFFNVGGLRLAEPLNNEGAMPLLKNIEEW